MFLHVPHFNAESQVHVQNTDHGLGNFVVRPGAINAPPPILLSEQGSDK